jgi:hypothetical protein
MPGVQEAGQVIRSMHLEKGVISSQRKSNVGFQYVAGRNVRSY